MGSGLVVPPEEQAPGLGARWVGSAAAMWAGRTARWPGPWRGLCSLFRKACRVALPLQLLLLLLLLLLFLLPVGEEHRGCAVANTFARSFRLMLRYSGPPPT